MKFILEENEYKELQSYKEKFDELEEQKKLQKEKFLEEYFEFQKGPRDKLVKIVVEKCRNHPNYTYYAWTEVTESLLTEAYRKNPKSEILEN